MGSERESQRSDIHGRFEEEIYRRLRDLVVAAGGIDLGLYKDRCVLRRIAVRQRACEAPDLRVYLRRVARDPIERAQLVKALTIHVSQFFRNPSTFRAIEHEALPCILSDKERTGARALRFWSVGCACGEGVLDWERIIAIVKAQCPRDIVFSVECGTPAQANKSLEHLNRLVA